jgi:tryptophan synthase alpha chain
MKSTSSGKRPVEGNGETRIARAFEQALLQSSAALMPYFTLGFPSKELSLAIVESIAPYSDLLELGIPFSDPIADGPTIQKSTQRALEMGTSPAGCLAMVADLRKRGVQTPALLMGYYNSILSYGEEQFARDAALAGADGLIVPDLPPEEADKLKTALSEEGLAYIPFLAPTSSLNRVRLVKEHTSGFIYVVSVTGVTGARAELSGHLPSFINSLRSQTKLPIAVGFGISTPAQAAEVGTYADGVIVGSALINAVDNANDKIKAAVAFVHSLREALIM